MPGRFVKVKCLDCNNVQVMFEKASTVVKCEVCGTTLAKPGAGKADIKGTLVEALDK
jgi:small subunit ribosomal protein S27e